MVCCWQAGTCTHVGRQVPAAFQLSADTLHTLEGWCVLTYCTHCVCVCLFLLQSLALAHVTVAEDDTVLFSTW
jgi:hypothetical protein